MSTIAALSGACGDAALTPSGNALDHYALPSWLRENAPRLSPQAINASPTRWSVEP
jgi:hypothetical protein